MSNIYIARQPIYDRKLNVFAYELLYRAGDEQNHANVTDGDDATSQVLINALMEIGLPDLVGQALAFINLTQHHILNGLPSTLAHENIVLEVLEDVVPDDALLTALHNLKQEGYTIALDDFILNDSNRSMVELADIIKIDIMELQGAALADQVKLLRPMGVKLLAEKVETPEEFEYCKALGFNYFQGYFFCKPNIVKGDHTPTSRMAIMQLLTKVQDPDLQISELQDLISRDVSLSYRILRYINSAHFNLGKKIESMQQAINLLGLNTIKTWVTILAMSSVDDKPYELILTALIRARMCETLSPKINVSPEHAFTVGLFSTLDAFIDKPLNEILATLPLADELHIALLKHTGELGELLDLTLNYERGHWQHIPNSHFDVKTLRTNYLDALRWAGELSDSLLSQKAA